MAERPLFERLIARHPLPEERERARVAKGLAEAAAAYAKQGSYEGAKGPWWRVWRAIERARGHRLREALAPLKPEARRWFALWSFAQGRAREGSTAYRAYLAEPGRIGPFDRENAVYLEHVASRGDAARVVRVADELMAKTPHGGLVPLIVLKALISLGDVAALAARYPRPAGATLHDGDAWAPHAMAQASAGHAREADDALTMCAKLGVGSSRDTSLLDVLLATLSVSSDEWARRRGPWDYPKDDRHAKWLADRGLRPEPTSEPSAHAFGGDDLTMPPCPGCAHRMHALYVVEVAAVPALQARLPGWRWLPLVGCLDCCLWLTRRDFRVDQDGRRVEIVGVSANAASLAELGKAVGEPLAPIARQSVTLRAIDPAAPPESDRTQIAGEPDWVQDFERPFCPLCHDEMTFVAALGSDHRSGLVPELMINNGSGYQYHFACAPCGTLAVFGQNT
jgi:hypothetical protein